MKNKFLYICNILFLLVILIFTFGGAGLREMFCAEADYSSLSDILSEDRKYIGQTVPMECLQDGGYVILLVPTEWEYTVAVHQPISEQDIVTDQNGIKRITLQSYVGRTWKGHIVYGHSEIQNGEKVCPGKERFS